VPIEVNVISTPAAYAYTPHDVCIGDTVALALTSRSTNAEEFNWWIDDVVMKTSPELSIVTADWRSSGPYRIRWNNAGQHIIKVKAIADSECPALTTNDTVKVHQSPDATFKFTTIRQKVCLEDSILFAANKVDYRNSYMWTPAHYFDNMNKPVQWGRVGELKSVVMLTVTDPFGCVGRETMEINPETCCKVVMPTAFTPNNDGKNDRFHPLFQGYHKFHTFRITNRWGQLVWETTNSEPSWDGTFNGVPQDMGVYFFYLKYDCGGKVLEEKGECTLVR
jgi:gliding motility-associated-like protein